MFIKRYKTVQELIEGILRAGQARLYVILQIAIRVGLKAQDELAGGGDELDYEILKWAAVSTHWVRVQLSQSYDLPDWGSLEDNPSPVAFKAHFQWLEWWISYEKELVSSGRAEQFHNDVFVLDRDALDEKWFPDGHWSTVKSTIVKSEMPISYTGGKFDHLIQKMIEHGRKSKGEKGLDGWSMN